MIKHKETSFNRFTVVLDTCVCVCHRSILWGQTLFTWTTFLLIFQANTCSDHRPKSVLSAQWTAATHCVSGSRSYFVREQLSNENKMLSRFWMWLTHPPQSNSPIPLPPHSPPTHSQTKTPPPPPFPRTHTPKVEEGNPNKVRWCFNYVWYQITLRQTNDVKVVITTFVRCCCHAEEQQTRAPQEIKDWGHEGKKSFKCAKTKTCLQLNSKNIWVTARTLPVEEKNQHLTLVRWEMSFVINFWNALKNTSSINLKRVSTDFTSAHRKLPKIESAH